MRSVLLVGLTGGLGSGKTTVATLLARRGAVVVDADDLARRAVEAGTPGLTEVARTFGPEVLRPDGTLDRDRLAAIVFADPEARRRLEAIVHPEVARLFAEEVEPHRSTDRVVVYDVPLLVERRLERAFDVVVVVEAPEDLRVARVVAARGMSEEEARSRIRSQAGDQERRAVADQVVRNDGTTAELDRQVNALWARLVERAAL